MLTRAGFNPETHSGKALVNVLETYPRDELFQIDEDTLYHFALSILQLEERPRVRVLARRDRFDRFVSVLVYVPRERYSGQVRSADRRISGRGVRRARQRLLSVIHDAPLTRVHFIIGRAAGPTPDPDRATLEEQVGAIVRTWTDALAEALARRYEPGRAGALLDALPRCVLRRLSRRLFAAGGGRGHPRHRGADGGAAARRRFLSRAARTAGPASASRSGATAARSRCRSACRCWRTWASAWSTSGPSRSRRGGRSRCLAARHGAGARRRRRRSISRAEARSRRRSSW